MQKNNLFKLPSNNFIFVYGLVTVITILGVSLITPAVMNYPPGSINTDFDIQMSYIPYYLQYTLGCILGLLFVSLSIKFSVREIDKWYQLPECKKYANKKMVLNIRKKCLKLPYILLIAEFGLPTLAAFIIFFTTGSHLAVLFAKLCILLISAGLILSVVSFIFSKSLYNQVLADTYKKGDYIGPRIGLPTKIFIQILPLIIICILITSLIGFSKITSEKGNLIFKIYSERLNNYFDKNKIYTDSEIIEGLNKIQLINNEDSIFIIYNDKTSYSSNNTEFSNFLIEYTFQLSEKYDGRTYDTYGLDTSGATIKLQTATGFVYAGILFTVPTNSSLVYYTIAAIVLLIISIVILFMFTKSLIDDLHFITNKFKEIYKTSNIQLVGELPIISNDEIGDLSHAFNRIQMLTKENIENIHDKQDMLVEKERLASLGQMIGRNCTQLKNPNHVYWWRFRRIIRFNKRI